jgi:predicted component of viral defense system (DUF524 family)
VVRGELTLLRHAVKGDGRSAGLVTVLPLLQSRHRRELKTEPHWSKEELVRHPEPRELIRSMRKPGNLDEEGRPTYTLDERRSLTSDIYENRIVRHTVDMVDERLRALAEDPASGVDAEAALLRRDLAGARRQAVFLDDVSRLQRVGNASATLTQDPLYRTVMAIRSRLQG